MRTSRSFYLKILTLRSQQSNGSVSGLEKDIAKGYGRRERFSLIEVQRAYMDQGQRLVSKNT